MKRRGIIADAAGEVESIGETLLLLDQRGGDHPLIRGLALRLQLLAGVCMSAVDGEAKEDIILRLRGP